MGGPVKNIVNSYIIHRDCSERFLPLRCQATSLLAEHGVEMAGISSLRTGYQMGRTRLYFHLLLYTVSGRGWLTLGGQRRFLTAGDLFVAPAGSAHLYGLAGRRWDIVWVHLQDIPAWSFLKSQQQHVRQAYELRALQGAMEGYLREALYPIPKARSAALHYAHIVMVLVERELRQYADHYTLRTQNRLNSLWDEVGASLGKPWTVKELAGRMHVSPVQFNRVCRRHGGLRPMERVRTMRMQRSRDLLQGTALPVKQIAALVGYTDPLAFSTAFRRAAGKSPRAYRKEVGRP
jgi:AraC-like DNA-binding protein